LRTVIFQPQKHGQRPAIAQSRGWAAAFEQFVTQVLVRSSTLADTRVLMQ